MNTAELTKTELLSQLADSEMRRTNAETLARHFYDELLDLRQKAADLQATLVRMQRAEIETQPPKD